MTTERRIVSQGTSVRAMRSGDKLSIRGISAPFNTYADLNGFRERIMPGAFSDVLKRAANGSVDIACLFNHDPNCLLGRMSNRTLSAEEVSSGLQYSCDLPDTSIARDVHALIEARSITGCSFGFQCEKDGQTWDEGYQAGEDDAEDEPRSKRTGKSFVRRTIHRFSMVTDLGPVTFPAYAKGTTVDTRNCNFVIPTGCPAEFRSLILHARTFDDGDYGIRQRRRNLLATVLG